MAKVPDYVSRDMTTEKLKLMERAILLDDTINKDIERETDETRLKILRNIKSMNSYTQEEFDTKFFVYNYGEFRTKEEIEEYNRKLDREEAWKRIRRIEEYNRSYHESGQYAEDCKQGKIACWLPVIIDFGLFLLGLCDPYTFYDMIMWTVLLSPLALFLTLIFMAIQAEHCKSLAAEYNVPSNDPDFQKAVSTSRAAKLGIIAGLTTAYKCGKSALKDLGNPEGWKGL